MTTLDSRIDRVVCVEVFGNIVLSVIEKVDNFKRIGEVIIES
jgi:hypothetical protein